MLKKLSALVLCVLLLISGIPMAHGATDADLKQAIADHYDAYAKSIYQKNAADNATDVLVKHALYQNGGTLHFSEKDPLTAALYESNLFRTFMIEALAVGSQAMLEKQQAQGLFGTSGLAWHDFALEYRVSQFYYNETPDRKDDKVMARHIPQTFYEGPRNDCDNAMILVVGGCNVRIWMHLLEMNFTSASYRVEVQVDDEFEFDGKYKEADKMGFNTTFSKLISALGPILGMDEFFWDSTSGFEITVPLVYRCRHQSGDYRWDHNGTDFVPVDGEGLTVVDAQRIEETNSDGSVSHYFQLAEPITLLHSVPWVLEFRQQGSAGFMLGPDTAWTSGEPYFLRTADHMVVGHYTPEPEQKGRHQYGFEVTALGCSWKDFHTFRIENRIAEDGTNMLWLLIDGRELGPMTHYYYNPDSKNTDMESTDTWASGVDFTIRYIGSKSFPIRGKFEYVAIWQDGPGNPHDPFITGTTVPTCTEPGYATRICLFCGYTEATENAPALGHTEELIPGTAPTCTAEGLTDGASCTVCGEILKTQEVIPALGHRETSIPGTPAACTQPGLTDGAECAACEEILKTQEAISPLGHRFENGLCQLCGEKDPGFPIGDADFDGQVTYQDALLILRASIGLEACSIPLCDTDGDGILTYQDALTVLRASIGLK